MKQTNALVVSALVLNAVYASPISSRQENLPTVDLGYEIHQAVSFNDQVKYYNFSNIPYAAPPLGDLRFAAPQPPPQGNRSAPSAGSGPRLCPQAGTSWITVSEVFLFEYYAALATASASTVDLDAITVLPINNTFVDGVSPGESEDCLYLDVMVPQAVFQGGSQSKAPVLVEIYGGGYTGGDKLSVGQGSAGPAALIERSNSSIIYIALNYRLGAFGWLAGPEFEAAGGVSNAGLLDQRQALEWVQQYIHLFGGDPDQVTIIGESAGGGSVEHQITAYGGSKGKVPFQRAIPQSPGYLPTRSKNYTDSTYQAFLKYAGASSLQELRQMDSSALMTASAKQIFENPVIGSFTYGPVVDGSFVPDLPSILFASGRFDQNVQIMAGHNTQEGGLFTSPYERNDSALIAGIETSLGSPPSIAEYIAYELYPAVYDGSQPYANWYERAVLIDSESAFICNNYYMLSATSSKSYGYNFNVYPGFHGQDVSYTFYSGYPPASSTNETIQNLEEVQYANIANTLQDWILTFTIDGKPTTSVPGSVNLPLYDSVGDIGSLIGVIGNSQVVIAPEPANNERCLWWSQGFYAPDPSGDV